MINFSLGVAHLHRAMQRKSDNRHLQIAQGIAFIFRYAEYSLGSTDHVFHCDSKVNANECLQPPSFVWFNIGRAFHQIQIVHLAEKYYRMALTWASTAPPDSPGAIISRQVAYNLMLIYVNSNAHALAQALLDEYLTV
jgi:hypothetical protein